MMRDLIDQMIAVLDDMDCPGDPEFTSYDGDNDGDCPCACCSLYRIADAMASEAGAS